MQQGIHPAYEVVQVHCSCGHQFGVRSATSEKKLNLDVCSKCHPFYTGQQKIVDTAGRVENFKNKYAFLDLGISSKE
jgi:large subunit ribosomal protein L31